MQRLAAVAGHLSPCLDPEQARSTAATSAAGVEALPPELMALAEPYGSAYARDGYVLISGLIPEEILSAAEDAVWSAMEEESEHWLSGDVQGGIKRGVPSTWPAEPKQFAKGINGPAVAALWTDAYRSMAAALSEHFAASQYNTPTTPMMVSITQPKGALAINILPRVARPEGWKWPSPHIDHSIESHGYLTFPRPVRMSTMTYLSDAPADEHAGSTVVWPGSHRLLADLAASDPARFELMHTLGHALEEAGVLDIQPVAQPHCSSHRSIRTLVCGAA